MKNKAVLVGLVAIGISVSSLASEKKEVGNIEFSWNNHGKFGLFVKYKGDEVNPNIGAYLGEGKGYAGPKAEAQIGKLVRASRAMGFKLVEKNNFSFGFLDWLKSFVTKPLTVESQTLRLYEDGSTSYEGKDSLKEEFEQDGKNAFKEFATLHKLQEDYKNQFEI